MMSKHEEKNNKKWYVSFLQPTNNSQTLRLVDCPHSGQAFAVARQGVTGSCTGPEESGELSMKDITPAKGARRLVEIWGRLICC